MRLFILYLIYLPLSAKSTLDLNTARTPGGTQLPNVAPTELPSTFLPLCGNGQLNTIADYQNLGASHATFAAYDPYSPSSPPVQATLYATETCDDGNRLDHDGCSADCMHRDLWISSCQLALDIPSSYLEAFVYVPAWDKVLLSTLTTLYSLNIHPEAGANSLHTTILATKSFAVMNVFVSPAGGVFLYSSTEQKVYQYTASGGLSVFKDMSHILSGGIHNGFQFPTPSTLAVFHDTFLMAVVDLAGGQSELPVCQATQSMEGALYLGGSPLILDLPRVDGRMFVTASSSSISCSDVSKGHSQPLPPDIWAGALGVIGQTASVASVNYAMTVTTDSGSLPTPSFMRMYVPAGLWVELPLLSPRSWIDPSSLQLAVLSPYIGSGLLMQASLASNFQAKVCSSNAQCVFDIGPSYDLLTNTGSTGGITWQNILQSEVNAINSNSFETLYKNSTEYSKLLNGFYWDVRQNTEPHAIRDSMTHPTTGNLWALRANGLYEIAKSGVQAALPQGTCMPSGLALCPACQWAISGGQCQPCTTKSQQWAWYALCQGCNLGRRLLRSSNDGVLIQFTVQLQEKSSLADIVTCVNQPSTVWSPATDHTAWDVKVWAQDPATCMRALVPALANFNVLVRPYTSVPLLPNDPINTNDNNVPLTVGGVIGGIVLLIILIAIGIYCFCWDSCAHDEHSYTQVNT